MIEKYEDLYDFNNLYSVSFDVVKNISWKYNTQKFIINRLYNVIQVQQKLKDKNYDFPKYRHKTIFERGKAREIDIASLQERMIQKLLARDYLIPILSKTLIYDNSATLKGKGLDFARKRVVKHLTEYYKKFGNSGYVLQLDFKSFFANINHEILFDLLKKYINDTDIFNLIKFLVNKGGDKGLTLGSELSQILAVWYPNKLDHYCKDTLRLKYYARYMDDIYIIYPDKKVLKEILLKIQKICEQLKITLSKNKTKITKLSNGFKFLKINYILKNTGKVVKYGGKESYKREKRRVKKMVRKVKNKEMTINELINNYNCWRGCAKKSYNKYIRTLDNYLKEQCFELLTS